jgi:AcrR family transcriptional regulator
MASRSGGWVPKVSAEHRERVRRRLLDAARTVVVREGPEGTTTRAILDEAGVSAGTLYNYFASKAELFEALAEDLLLGEAAVLRGTDESLRDFVGAIFATPDNPAFAWFRGRMSTNPDVQAAQRRLNEYIVGLFAPMVREEQAAGTLPADLDPEAVVELIDLLFDALNRRHAVNSYVTSFERVGTALLQILNTALQAQHQGDPTR